MSFDFSPNVNLSNVQKSSKTTDGGAGNTGYYQRSKNEQEEILIHKKEDEGDSFTYSDIVLEEEKEFNLFEELKKIYVKLLVAIKGFFKKISSKK